MATVNKQSKSKPLLSSDEILKIMKGQPKIIDHNNNNNILKANRKHSFSNGTKTFSGPNNAVKFKAGYKLTVKYNPLYISLHDKKTHTYVMYFQLLPTIGKDSNRQNTFSKRMMVP